MLQMFQSHQILNKNTPSNHSLIASWKLNDYSINYSLNGGTVASANKTLYTAFDS